ncbi:MAG: Asp-tRNA(Asn)/Glu-tRNA(Gln) amidotransferase subunit GatB [Candidatus Kerfeldbacteria bacterium CG15_BIG_FIL_POST_REV_8_21_14_020_45_12]|uniref:Aspartyl/glutamyl-tRNA(Asn/Gln) amidotransferase subunit B n=1 Tax=Candidatus Kerfeldbacteria bacterium CG15_BIG_FIL_POST_REV_8_21_14_020_45_12 TaxID=2014247 RepID=A0A2M7H4M2_9BACT|nr:MAG: Asp-tRNA(Asn)/Glu-tRNA(Gln) amidotransferase subunit GatB [Candidatus Kerfeldbacteria bacterium CG15_BIG_FIL_POST_REV_8_21_14_020_45_12]PJA93653.1 MAG: Asp-tRNA(Asn)/Glu-tRNA(Gln) amidotransferase subunit GatB [Candidatus Kerfeldbacteria bacterium CG_4_9_14_3_um_filter_45_8]
MSKTTYEAIIGLEIHIRLDTKSKIFSGESNAESEQPNTHVSPISLGHPGTLPQLNQEAIRLGMMLALALNCEIPDFMKFDRKHYFYPDLPKGYQISQYDKPLALNGYLEILPDDIHSKRVRIERIHLEEDAAKNKHSHAGDTLIDFNRAGQPLAELVTQPDLRTAQEAKVFAQELQQIARYVGASQANMQHGHLRCDVNVSLRPIGDEALYPKTEVKNINSFKAIERAVEFEIKRQTEMWDNGSAPEITTTRGWDDKRGISIEQRTKEGEADYRYMPEPDLPPVIHNREDIDNLRSRLPELPSARRQRFRDEYNLSYHDAKLLLQDPRVGNFFEEVISELRSWLNSLDDTVGSDEEIWKEYGGKVGRLTTAWITSELFAILKETGEDFGQLRITGENFAELLTLLYEKRVNSSAGQKILRIMYEKGGDPSVIMQEHDLLQVSDEGEVDTIVQRIIEANTEVVADFKNGKDKALMYLVGQVMKETKGKINPEVATSLLKDKLNT